MASPQSFPGLTSPPPPRPPRPPSARNTSRERPSCFAPPSPPSGPVLVDESVASGQRSTADWTTLDPRCQINSRYESQVIVTRIKSSWGPICYKPSKLLTITGCRKYDSMTCRSTQRFCVAHHTPGLGALVANLVRSQIDVRDGLVDFKCLGKGLEAATD